MTTTKQKLKNYILKNPGDGNNKAIASKFGTTSRYVSNCKNELREAGQLAAYDATSRRKAGDEVSITDAIKAAFKKKDVYSIEHLSTLTGCNKTNLKTAIDELIEGGHNIKIDKGNIIFSKIIERSKSKVIDVSELSTGFYKFGVTGDNHLCSRYERLDVLNALYDQFKRENITTVFNTGNWIDGEARFNKHDLLVHGLDNQVNYFIEKYPQREGITTHYITGDDHEGWYTQREGINVGRYAEIKAMEAGRNDLRFLGHMEADIILKAPKGQTKLRVLHPGGGSSYAISYTSQKIVESYTGGEKPDILFDGHYHKAGYNYIRGVHVVQTGCTQDQTPFMRKKRLAAHLGGWIIEFAVDSRGAVTRFKQEFIPFYDNEYYKSWGYKWK